MAGNWEGSLAIFDSEPAEVRLEVEKYIRQSSELRRVRIAESPVTPYLQWEMQSFKVLHECGLPIRVLDGRQVKHLEAEQPLSELVVVGHQALFDVRYDEHWKAIGARRIDDRAVIDAANVEIAELWEQAEPLGDYFQREIAPLPPPLFGE